MAENDANSSNNPGSGKKNGLSRINLVIIGVALAAIGYGILSDDPDSASDQAVNGAGEFDPELAAEEEQQQRERLQQLRNGRSGEGEISGDTIDPYAAMAAMTRRQEMLESQLQEVTEKLEEANGADAELNNLEENYERLETQLTDLTELLKQRGANERFAERDASRDANNREDDDLAFDLEGASQSDIADGSIDELPDFGGNLGGSGSSPREPAKSRSIYGDNYIILNNDAGPQQVAGGSFNVPNPFDSQSSKNGGSQDQSNEQSVEPARDMPPEYGSEVKPGYDDGRVSSQVNVAAEDSGNSSDEVLHVPAFSFVEAETLHGLDCPIGADLPRSSNDDSGGATPGATQPMPVVLPLRGKIRGPNGKVVNLGTAHLQGWCIGRRVDRGENGRAFIKVEAISYWDRHGEAQYLPNISGDVISLIDNHRGIQAPVDEVRRSYLGEQASAAALASAATELSSAQFSETRNPNGGVDRVFDGDRGVAYASTGASAAFEKVAALINEEARAAFDAVRVSPGSPVKIMFMKPFEVTNHKLEVEDELLDAYDILI